MYRCYYLTWATVLHCYLCDSRFPRLTRFCWDQDRRHLAWYCFHSRTNYCCSMAMTSSRHSCHHHRAWYCFRLRTSCCCSMVMTSSRHHCPVHFLLWCGCCCRCCCYYYYSRWRRVSINNFDIPGGLSRTRRTSSVHGSRRFLSSSVVSSCPALLGGSVSIVVVFG